MRRIHTHLPHACVLGEGNAMLNNNGRQVYAQILRTIGRRDSCGRLIFAGLLGTFL